MATIGVFCGDLAQLDVPVTGGGGSKRTRKHAPGVTSNRAIAMREDEEFIAAIGAFLASRRKH